MAEKLGEIGKVLSSIAEAVKTVKSMRQKNGQLYRIIEETKEQAVQLEKLQIPDEPLLQELKETVGNVRNSGSQLVTWIQNFGVETDSFDKSVRNKIRANTLPSEAVAEFCTDLNKMFRMAKDFSKAFEAFTGHLSKAEALATSLTTKLNQEQQRMQKQADSAKTRGAAGTVGLALAGAGLVALGFFTGGAAWVAAGSIAGAACGVGAVAVGAKTASSVREMRQLASGIQENAGKLETLAKDLKSSSDRAGEIHMDKGAVESLETALEFFRRDQEKEAEMAAKDARIAALEAKLQSLGH